MAGTAEYDPPGRFDKAQMPLVLAEIGHVGDRRAVGRETEIGGERRASAVGCFPGEVQAVVDEKHLSFHEPLGPPNILRDGVGIHHHRVGG